MKKKLLLLAVILGIISGYMLFEKKRELASSESNTFRYFQPLKVKATKRYCA